MKAKQRKNEADQDQNPTQLISYLNCLSNSSLHHRHHHEHPAH